MSIGRGTATLTLDSNADDSTQLFCEHPDMNKLKLAAAVVVAVAAAPVMAADTWIGTANYGAGAETVGPFNTYDFSSGGVLLIKPTSSLTSARLTTASRAATSARTPSRMESSTVAEPIGVASLLMTAV